MENSLEVYPASECFLSYEGRGRVVHYMSDDVGLGAMGECGRKVGLEVQSDWKIISIATVNSAAIALAAFERRRREGMLPVGMEGVGWGGGH